MRLDGVEIKANVAGTEVAAAVSALDLDDENSMKIWFYEDLTPGVVSMPLLESGLILRVRVKNNGDVDSTVKLRPCRRSQLTARWLSKRSQGDLEFTIEEDRSAASRVLVASCQLERDAGQVVAFDGPPYALTEVLDETQREFLDTCSSVRVNVAELSVLGPIEATRWKDVGGAEFADLKARAERWSVAGTEFLEVSSRTDAAGAEPGLARLHELLTRRGVALDSNKENKTRLVLALLAPQR